jgi:hypothetical protein
MKKRRIAMAIPAEIMMLSVDSSNVSAFGYDTENQVLYVEFLSKAGEAPAQYMYFDVEPELYEQFVAAPSKGKFVWSHLRDRYEYDRIQ